MTNDKYKEFPISGRDQEILGGLCVAGCLTARQIHSHYFSTANYRNTLRRLKKLSDYGFITRVSRHDGLATSIYFPNVPSLQKILPNEIVKKAIPLKSVRPWYFPNTEHDDLVRDISIRISKEFPSYEILLDFQIVSGVGHEQLIIESDKRKVPDILVKDNQGSSYYLEVELSTKSSKRYTALFQSYLLRHNFAIIYFYKEDRTHGVIDKVLHASGLDAFPILFQRISTGEEKSSLLDIFRSAKEKNKLWTQTKVGQATSSPAKKLKLSDFLE